MKKLISALLTLTVICSSILPVLAAETPVFIGEETFDFDSAAEFDTHHIYGGLGDGEMSGGQAYIKWPAGDTEAGAVGFLKVMEGNAGAYTTGIYRGVIQFTQIEGGYVRIMPRSSNGSAGKGKAKFTLELLSGGAMAVNSGGVQGWYRKDNQSANVNDTYRLEYEINEDTDMVSVWIANVTEGLAPVLVTDTQPILNSADVADQNTCAVDIYVARDDGNISENKGVKVDYAYYGSADQVNLLMARQELEADMVLGDNPSADEVVYDLPLPAAAPGRSNVSVAWTSEDPELIADDGTVTAPAESETARAVVNAVLTCGDFQLEKSLTFTVRQYLEAKYIMEENFDYASAEELRGGYGITMEDYGTCSVKDGRAEFLWTDEENPDSVSPAFFGIHKLFTTDNYAYQGGKYRGEFQFSQINGAPLYITVTPTNVGDPKFRITMGGDGAVTVQAAGSGVAYRSAAENLNHTLRVEYYIDEESNKCSVWIADVTPGTGNFLKQKVFSGKKFYKTSTNSYNCAAVRMQVQSGAPAGSGLGVDYMVFGEAENASVLIERANLTEAYILGSNPSAGAVSAPLRLTSISAGKIVYACESSTPGALAPDGTIGRVPEDTPVTFTVRYLENNKKRAVINQSYQFTVAGDPSAPKVAVMEKGLYDKSGQIAALPGGQAIQGTFVPGFWLKNLTSVPQNAFLAVGLYRDTCLEQVLTKSVTVDVGDAVFCQLEPLTVEKAEGRSVRLLAMDSQDTIRPLRDDTIEN